MKFRKRPVVIDAHQFLPGVPGQEYPDWYIRSGAEGQHWMEDGSNNLKIKTLEGVMTASPGDWIILGVKGEIYPCKPDIFELTYEAIPPAAPPSAKGEGKKANG